MIFDNDDKRWLDICKDYHNYRLKVTNNDINVYYINSGEKLYTFHTNGIDFLTKLLRSLDYRVEV